MRRTIAAAIATLLLLGGCSPQHPWFGGDVPEPTTAAPCPLPALPSPSDGGVHVAPPGKVVSQISVSFIAVAFGPGGCKTDMPLTIQVHLYGTADGRAVFTGPMGDPLPYDALKTTPWTTTFFLTHPAGTAPVVMIDASATIQDSPIDPARPDLMLRCIVRYAGNPVALDPTGPPLPTGNRFIHCNVTFGAPI